MMHEPIVAEGGDAIDAEIQQALDDVATEITALQRVSRLMTRLRIGSSAYQAEASYADDLLSRIEKRAAAVQTPDGPLTANALLRLAGRAPAPAPTGTTASMAEIEHCYIDALELSTDRLRALTAAQRAYDEARSAERVAYAAYRHRMLSPSSAA